MEWIEKLNASIEYIESHLTEEIDVDQLARIACCSSFHYQRMFAYMAGVPLSEYIRRRRMSLAAVDLASGDQKIVDIALKYGYSSPTAFNRAFQSIHGIAPSLVREEGTEVKSFPPLTFKVIVKGAEELNYRIEKKDAFCITGISQPLHREIEKNFEIVPNMWQNAVIDGTLQKLAQKITGKDGLPAGLLGVSVCSDEDQWKYYIAAATQATDAEAAAAETSNADGAGFETYTVPAALWAVFPGSGTNTSMQELERRIITEWLPSSGYEYADAPDVEVYLNPDPANAVYEVWIPVRKK